MAAAHDSLPMLRQMPPVLVDVVLAALVGVVTVLAAHLANEPGTRPVDELAYVLGLLIGVWVLGRRRFPIGVLLATAATLSVYYALDYAGFSPALSLAVSLYTAAAAGRIRVSLVIVAGILGAELVARGIRDGEPVLPLVEQAVEQGGLMVAVVLLGATVRNRRAWLDRAEADREAEAARRVGEERLRMARELHDVLAHTVTAITVQAGVADEVLDDDPGAARTALGAIRVAGREAMAELTATVGLLRSTGDALPRAPVGGLGGLDELVATTRDAGVRVESLVTGEPRQLSVAVRTATYRIVQESLTNVLRHAAARQVTVTLRYEPADLTVEIADDGHGCPAPQQPGHGLTGMRERVVALGGELDAGPRHGAGFVVRARLPAASVGAGG